MVEKNIINEIPIGMNELKKELEKIKKRDKELISPLKTSLQ